MFAQLRLPPSERDFEVYEYVVVGGGSTRGAARYYDLSQTRICQIVQQVAEWQANVVPKAADQHSAEDLTVLAKNTAGRRLQYIYDEAMHAWRESQGQSCVVHNNNKGDIDRVMQVQFGQPRYLHLAIRATMQQAKLAVLPGLVEGLQADAVEQAAQLTVESQTAANAPPARDCSGAGDLSAQSEPHDADESPECAVEPTTCANAPAADADYAPCKIDPVQPQPTAGESGPVVELRVAPDQPGVAVQVTHPSAPLPAAAPTAQRETISSS